MDNAIDVINLTKDFPSFRNPKTFKEWLVTFLHPSKKNIKSTHFTALKSITFSVKRGECLGVIGKNGAGKSTLLTLLLGSSTPTEGNIRVHGKRTPLLDLGAGFHPDLTGRENIFLNGVLLGLSLQEIKNKMDEIILFSEIKPFIDMPVRTYSSGMYLRLAFSVAIHTNPEIFLIDEILAVGDESFLKKSENALVSLIKSGLTTVFVSHNMEAVKKICNRVIWLDHGEIRSEGDPGKVIEDYLRS